MRCVGWVRNLKSGAVEAHIQGAADAVETALAEIARAQSRRIARVVIADSAPDSRCVDFQVARSANDTTDPPSFD
jgi:acylphosphatase